MEGSKELCGQHLSGNDAQTLKLEGDFKESYYREKRKNPDNPKFHFATPTKDYSEVQAEGAKE